MENNTNNVERKRGGCLSTFLIVFIIMQAIGIISNIGSVINPTENEEVFKVLNMKAPSRTYIIISIIISVVILVGLILTFLWKKVGVYMYIGGYVVNVIAAIINATSILAIVSAIIGAVIVVGIYLLLIKKVFEYME